MVLMPESQKLTKSFTVVQTVPYFQPGIGGPDYYLCKGLSELHNKVYLLTSDRKRPGFSHTRHVIRTGQMSVDGFEVCRFRTLLKIGSIPVLDWHVSRFVSNLDFDIVHAHEIYYPHSVQSFRVARKKGKVFGTSQHRYNYPRNVLGLFLKTYYLTTGRKIFDLCDFVCAISSSAANFLRNIGVKREIYILPNSVDVERFRPMTGRHLKEKLGLEDNRIILYVGRLHKEKGVEYLVDAFKTIKQWHPDVVLVIVGKGSEKESLVFQAKKLSLQQSILFMDYLPHEMLPELYNSCDILTSPSIVEPFGMVLIEAMACGKPVVGSKVGGIKDIIDDGENGFLVEPGRPDQLAEKIHLILSDKKMQKRFGTKAREKVEDNYSYQAVAKKAMSIYEQALERR